MNLRDLKIKSIILFKQGKNYYQSFFSENAGNSRLVWKGINSAFSRKKNDTQIIELNYDDSDITSPLEICNTFN